MELFKDSLRLKMSLFKADDFAQTVRHYTQLNFDERQITGICRDITDILSRRYKDKSNPLSLANSLKKSGQLLWDHLFSKPVKQKLKSLASSNLVIMMDEELTNIPWELLYDGQDFLSLKFDLGRIVRSKNELGLNRYRSVSQKPKMLVLANPTNDLDSAYREGIFIKNQFDKNRSRIGVDFKSTNIDSMYVKRNLRDYDIVHFAGHCESKSSDVSDTGWVLSDNIFTADDIIALSESSPLPSLVFSNACHSAQMQNDLSDIECQERAYTLGSAFLFSGVRHYIGAIRKIEDNESLRFAREFYGGLTSGNSLGKSLRLARMKLIKEYGLDNISWASYVLYGDPSYNFFGAQNAVRSSTPQIANFKRKKAVSALAVTGACCLIFVGAIRILPSINPSTYAKYSNSSKLYLSGKNEKVIDICGKIVSSDPGFLPAYPLLGDAYRRMGKKDLALKYYFQYAMQSEKKNDNNRLACAYSGIGWIYHMHGDYPKALEFYNKALSLSRKNSDKLNEADVLGKLAVWYMDKDDNDKALELLTKSSEINRQRINIYRHKYNLACDYFNLGLLFTNKDDYATAKEFYDKSFVLFKELKLKHELSDYYFNIGEVYKFQKEYLKAMDYYQKGLEIDTEQGHKPNIACAYTMIGELYVDMDNLSEAEKYFKLAISSCKDIDAQLELAEAYHDLGLLYKQQGRKNKAREHLRLAQEIYKKVDLPYYEEIKTELLSLYPGG